MNVGTVIVVIILIAIVLLIIRSMIRDKKKGKSALGCGGDCSRCRGCH